MNSKLLVDAIVRQTTVLIAQLCTAAGVRAPLAHLAQDGVISLRFEASAVIVETARPDAFYTMLTEVAASGEAGRIDEVTSPDDNLQAVFRYLVKQ